MSTEQEFCKSVVKHSHYLTIKLYKLTIKIVLKIKIIPEIHYFQIILLEFTIICAFKDFTSSA